MKPQSFFRGTATLAGAGIATKTLGALFTVTVARLIGAEGVGLLQMAFPVFGMALVLCSSGMSLATSKLVSERLAAGDRISARQILHACLLLVTPAGAVFSLALYFGAGFVASFVLRDPRASLPLRCLSPAVAIIAVSGAIQGYFEGNRTMTPTAVSHVVEQVVRVAAGLGLACTLARNGAEWAAAGSALGASLGAQAALVFLAGSLLVAERRATRVRMRPRWAGATEARTWPARTGWVRRGGVAPSRTTWGTARQILAIAGPARLAAIIGSLLRTVNAAAVPIRLRAAGFSSAESAALFGRFSVMAMSLVTLPGVLTSAISTSLVPRVAAACVSGSRRRLQRLGRQAVRAALLIGVPVGVGLRVLSVPISGAIFGDPAGAVPLSTMAFGTPFLCLQQVAGGFLNGMGEVRTSVRNGIVGSFVALTVTYVLTGMPSIGIRGAALGSGLGFLVAGILNALAVGEHTGDGARILGAGLRPLLCSLLAAPVARGAYQALAQRAPGGVVAVSAALLAGIASYGVALMLLGEFKHGEIAMIPGVGGRLASALVRLRLIRG